MTTEFELIKQHFTRKTQHTDLGVGDDAALLQVSEGHQLVVSTDMSLADVHFFSDANPYDIGWKSLAVNVSDMAAMGAVPKWATLAIALPQADEAWVAEFANGFFACADAFNIDLIGGDTTRGSLNVGVQMMGEVPKGQALTRAGAKLNDDIWVSGALGQAALGLAHLQNKVSLAEGETALCLKDLHHPEPRVMLGLALLGVATSCIDVSDGLLADLGHIVASSQIGARLQVEQLPHLKTQIFSSSPELVRRLALNGGDDYELCFTAPAQSREDIALMSQQLNVQLTRIGVVIESTAIELLYNQQPFSFTQTGFDHFAKS